MAKGRNTPNISDVVTQRRAVLAQWLESIQSNANAAPPADLDYSFKNKTSPQEIPLAVENFSALPQDGTPYKTSA